MKVAVVIIREAILKQGQIVERWVVSEAKTSIAMHCTWSEAETDDPTTKLEREVRKLNSIRK